MTFSVRDPGKGKVESLDVKILRTQVANHEEAERVPRTGPISFDGDALYIPCGQNSLLKILQVQPANSRKMSCGDFRNGLGSRALTLQ